MHQRQTKTGLAIPNTLTRIKDDTIAVSVANLLDHEVTWNAGALLSTAEEIEESTVNQITVSSTGTKEKITEKKLPPLNKEEINCENPQMRQKKCNLLDRYRDACWKEGEEIGRYTGEELEIPLKDEEPVNRKQCRVPVAEQGPLKKEINKLIK